MSLISLLAGSLIAVVFGWAAIAKVTRFVQWKLALQAYHLAPRVAGGASVGVPVAEAAVVALLVLGQARAGAALTLGLLAIFSLGLLHARREEGDRLPCGCFGRVIPRDFRLLVARNAALAALAALVLFGGRDQLLTVPLRPDSTALLPAALIVLGLSAAVWVSRELAEASRRQ